MLLRGLHRALHRLVFAQAWVSFVVLVASFLTFAGLTVNLAFVLKANLDLIAEHGWMALADGAAQQFVEIVATAVLAMAAYVLFKACEHRLVHGLTDPPRQSGA
jgi:hypothetical protein